jgi:hypothetical protein
MGKNAHETLALLKFELKFLEDGGYGRSPHAPRNPTYAFTDSPTCLNFNDPARPHPCSECTLMDFVPAKQSEEAVPCWAIPIGPQGETVGDFYRGGTQPELETALKVWLEKQIAQIEGELAAA